MINKDTLMQQIKNERAQSNKLHDYNELLIEAADIEGNLVAYNSNLDKFYIGELDYKVNTHDELFKLFSHNTAFVPLVMANGTIKPFSLLSIHEGKREKFKKINHIFIKPSQLLTVEDETILLISVVWFNEFDGKIIKVNANINKSFNKDIDIDYSWVLKTPSGETCLIYSVEEGERCLGFIERLFKC